MHPEVDTKERLKYIGKCENLPFSKGDRVFIPKGTPILSLHPSHGDLQKDDEFKNPYNTVSKKGQWVTVAQVHNGWNAYLAASENAGGRNPSITWAGKGRYWMEVDINYVRA